MQRIIGRCFTIAMLVLIAFPLASMAKSQKALNKKLKGDYSFKRFRSCIQNQDGFTADLRLQGPNIFGNFRAGAAAGIRIYNGDGTGTVTGVNLNVFTALGNPGFPSDRAASQSQFTSPMTYSVAADGSFTENLTSVTGTVVAGPGTGNAFRITGIQIDGEIGSGKKILTLSDTSTNAELVEIWTPGPIAGSPDLVRQRICSRSGTAIK